MIEGGNVGMQDTRQIDVVRLTDRPAGLAGYGGGMVPRKVGRPADSISGKHGDLPAGRE